MKLSCEIIEDLLPLYSDGVCSNETKRAVELHLEKCKHCKDLIEVGQTVAVPAFEPDNSEADHAVKKGLKKIRLRWRITILVILVLIPVAFLFWNEFSGRGVAFTNQNELAIANRFMTYLVEGNYEKAYSCWDFDYTKQLWLADWFTEEELTNMEADGLAKFCELGQEVAALGGIESFEYIGTSDSYAVGFDGLRVHYIHYKILFNGKALNATVHVSDNGVKHFSAGNEIMDPLERLGMWSEWLWQDYKGCYYDPEKCRYVYYNND